MKKSTRNILGALLCTGIMLFAVAEAAEDQEPMLGSNPIELTDEQLKKGANLLRFKDYSDEDPMPLVKMYDGLRVADVLDAMQAIGLQDTGLMDHSIRPLWRDMTDSLKHRIYGVAVTYQYLPTNKRQAGQMSYEEFRAWHTRWYKTFAPEVLTVPKRCAITPGPRRSTWPSIPVNQRFRDNCRWEGKPQLFPCAGRAKKPCARKRIELYHIANWSCPPSSIW